MELYGRLILRDPNAPAPSPRLPGPAAAAGNGPAPQVAAAAAPALSVAMAGAPNMFSFANGLAAAANASPNGVSPASAPADAKQSPASGRLAPPMGHGPSMGH